MGRRLETRSRAEARTKARCSLRQERRARGPDKAESTQWRRRKEKSGAEAGDARAGTGHKTRKHMGPQRRTRKHGGRDRTTTLLGPLWKEAGKTGRGTVRARVRRAGAARRGQRGSTNERGTAGRRQAWRSERGWAQTCGNENARTEIGGGSTTGKRGCVEESGRLTEGGCGSRAE
ncbi:hypothetical protein ERJ75_000907200 [Trypanosoma vivax]|nr:hypothetical protein ERJ75_000907200 [Trypanosoma vivax]